jgi:predicted small metal-binding protein
MKTMHCGDLVPGCPAVVESESEDEIVAMAGKHAVEAHGLEVTPEFVEQVRGVIREAPEPPAAPA